MPQTLTPQWKEKELGENWQQISDTYLHTFCQPNPYRIQYVIQQPLVSGEKGRIHRPQRKQD